MKRIFVLVSFLAACSSSGVPGSTTDGATGGSTDLGVGLPDLAASSDGPAGDLAYTAARDMGPLLCGTQTCGGGQVCCLSKADGGGLAGTCASSCDTDMGSFTLQCLGPGHCGGNPCCVSVVKGDVAGGALCTAQQTDCAPAVDFASQSGMTRLCDTDGDCTAGAPATSLNQCCTAMSNGVSQRVCLNGLIAALSKGQVTCP